jgi:hypothetical protein
MLILYLGSLYACYVHAQITFLDFKYQHEHGYVSIVDFSLESLQPTFYISLFVSPRRATCTIQTLFLDLKYTHDVR